MTNLPSLPIGTELVGDYRIERILGAGGFGITYLAREIDVDRLVTIKEYFPTDFASRAKDLGAVPRSSGSGDDYDWGLDRFIDEARTLGKFDHRHIVRLYRYFRSNNTGYMVLHFEEGQSLKSWLRSLGRAPRQKELDRLVAPLLEALSVIHAADFLHRDIAPDNIIVRKDDSPVLIDFGSARGEIAQHTRTISALVKPGYSPYEQYAETGKQQGPWTDIYAFAGTLYHAVTGKRPPDAPSRIIKDELISTKAAAIGAYRPGFLAAIDHGLSLDIDQRPRSIAEWRGELLAPAPASPGWFGRSSKETGESESQTVLATAAATVPITGNEDAAPPPDAPGKEGQFVDFVDRLKQRNQKRFAKSAEDVVDVENTGEPEPVVGQQPDAVKKSSSRFRLGWGARRKSNALQKTATPDQAKKTDAVDDDGDQAAGKSAEVLPVAVESRTPPRIFKHSRPRPIRSLAGRRWRALAFRLMIGFGLAAGVVAMQDRLPKLEFRSSGTVSSGQEPSSPVTTTPARQRRKITPPAALLLHAFRAHEGPIAKAAFADNGRLIVTAGADATMKVWETSTRNLLRTIELDDGPATALDTQDSTALTGHSEGVIALWDLEAGTKSKSFKRNAANIWAVTFAGNTERFWSAGHDWEIALWETQTPSEPLHVLKGHERAVQALAYSPAHTLLLSGGADNQVKLWNGAGLSLLRTYGRTRDFVMSVAFSPDGDEFAVGTLDGRIRLMTRKSRRYREIRAHSGAVISLKYLTDGGGLISASRDGFVKLWNVKRRRVIRTYGAGSRAVHAADIAAGSGIILSADEAGMVRLWRGVPTAERRAARK